MPMEQAETELENEAMKVFPVGLALNGCHVGNLWGATEPAPLLRPGLAELSTFFPMPALEILPISKVLATSNDP